MQRSITFLLSLILFISCSTTSSPNNKDETILENEVLSAFQQLVSASKKLNQNAYFALIDQNNFTGLKANGSNWNSFKELQNDITSGFNLLKQVNDLQFPNLVVTIVNSETAILVNEYQQTATLKDGTEVSFAGGGTQVWSKSSGNWLLISISASIKP